MAFCDRDTRINSQLKTNRMTTNDDSSYGTSTRILHLDVKARYYNKLLFVAGSRTSSGHGASADLYHVFTYIGKLELLCRGGQINKNSNAVRMSDSCLVNRFWGLVRCSLLEIQRFGSSARIIRSRSELARAGDRYNRHQPRGHSPLTRFSDRPRPLGSTLVTSHIE
eukprot:6174290-Pleurochrysis_carterae.AAC.1